MHLEHGKNVLVADKAAVFAKHIVQLHRDPDLWQRLSQNGLKTIEQHFSMAAAKRNTQRAARATPSASLDFLIRCGQREAAATAGLSRDQGCLRPWKRK